MSKGGTNAETLEKLCREGSQEMASVKLNLLIEQIDRLLEAQHKILRFRRAA